MRPPDVLDERAAQDIAVKNGVGVVLAGSIGRQGSGYSISMKVTQAVTGKVIDEGSNPASSKDQVLRVATRLADSVREALGDDTSDDSTAVCDGHAVGHIGRSGAGLRGRHGRDLQQQVRGGSAAFSKAVDRDPNFGMGWTALAMASFNLDKLQDTEKYVKTAMRHIDTMTERERYRTRGLFYLATNDYKHASRSTATW